MGRAERRRSERNKRIQERKDKLLVSRKEIAGMKEDIANDVSEHNVETLMTCFALAAYRLHGFKYKRILRLLSFIDDLMSDILDGSATIEDYMQELENETGIIIKCK